MSSWLLCRVFFDIPLLKESLVGFTCGRARQDFAATSQAYSGIFAGRTQVVDVAFIYRYDCTDHHIGHYGTPRMRGSGVCGSLRENAGGRHHEQGPSISMRRDEPANMRATTLKHLRHGEGATAWACNPGVALTCTSLPLF